MSQFQLFPPPSPGAKGSKNPFRKGLKKPAAKAEPTASIPLEEIKDSPRTESVMFQIIEDTQRISPPPPAHMPSSTSPSGRVASPGSRSLQSPRSRTHQDNVPSHQALPSQRSMSNSSKSSRTAMTATSSGSPQSSLSSISPVPMRSMFPQFNPQLPLNKQPYHPETSNEEQPVKASRRPKLTLSPSSEIDQVLGPKTVPASVVNFPTGVLEPEEIRYSSPQELGMLWETANGQRPLNLCGSFNLRMTRTGPATFTFGNSQQPFYTLQTYSNDELSISRGDPSKPNSDVPIMGLTLENRIRREHPHDGLVALLFSRLAAMLAIDQAKEIGMEHHLSPSEAAEVESRSLKRAAAQESCRLSWNTHQRLYELRHPSLSKRNPPALVGAAGIPLSPVRSQSSGMLHITVSAPSGDASPHQPPTIIVTGPVSSTAFEAAQQAATARTSTLPVTDSDEPLASLDFGTKTLSISPAAVIATIPSLYAIDSLVAAMLAVAVSDEATNPILADMVHGSSSPSRSGTLQEPSGLAMPYRGPLVTTLAEREDAAESFQLASQIESAQAGSADASKKKNFFRFWNQSWSRSRSRSRSRSTSPDKSRPSKKNQQIVIEEFDLEKYGRYGASSSRESEKLPGIVRGVLRVLFWGLGLVVKGLTLVVKILAWVLVSSTRCLTSEKF